MAGAAGTLRGALTRQLIIKPTLLLKDSEYSSISLRYLESAG